MKAYVVVQECYFDSLESSVNEHIRKGYRPIGGITIEQSNSGLHYYYQAMILDKNFLRGMKLDNLTQ